MTAQPRLQPLCQPRSRRCPHVQAQVGHRVSEQAQDLVWDRSEAQVLVQGLARAKVQGWGLGQGQVSARVRAEAEVEVQARALAAPLLSL